MEVAGAASTRDGDGDHDDVDDNDNGDEDNEDKLVKVFRQKATHLCREVAGAGKNGGEGRRVGRCRESPERKLIKR